MNTETNHECPLEVANVTQDGSTEFNTASEGHTGREQNGESCPADTDHRGAGESPAAAERVNGAELLTQLRDVMARYVVLPPMAAETLALWVVHTYAFTLRTVTTYIGIESAEKRCGKTTLLRLLEKVANRPLIAANITPSALFRVIEETQPTLLIDEADTFLRGRNAMQGILNAGYDREGAYVMRVAGQAEPFTNYDGRFAEVTEGRRSWAKTRLARYSVWCPKVMAGIGALPETLADRCILITMQRKAPMEACARLRTLRPEEFRSRCAAFVRERAGEIAKAEPEIPAALNDRAADIWEPLLVLAELAGGEWPALARKAALELSGRQSGTDALGQLLQDVCALFVQAGRQRMFSREILAALESLRNRPWESLRKGRELSGWWLGAQLREAGVQRRTMRIGEELGKGYALEDIAEALEKRVDG